MKLWIGLELPTQLVIDTAQAMNRTRATNIARAIGTAQALDRTQAINTASHRHSTSYG